MPLREGEEHSLADMLSCMDVPSQHLHRALRQAQLYGHLVTRDAGL